MTFYTKEKFQEDIEDLVWLHDISYLDAIITFCEEKGIDVEDVIPLITPYLKNELFANGVDNGILKREPTISALF